MCAKPHYSYKYLKRKELYRSKIGGYALEIMNGDDDDNDDDGEECDDREKRDSRQLTSPKSPPTTTLPSTEVLPIIISSSINTIITIIIIQYQYQHH